MKKILFIGVLLTNISFAVQNNTDSSSVVNAKDVTIIINKEKENVKSDKKVKKCKLNYLAPIDPYMDNY